MAKQVFRIAPSPTGELHIGTLGMALVNYMMAKASGGKFLIRIDDTDTARTIEGAEKRLLEGLGKFGIVFDNPKNILRQSERGDIYKKVAEDLVKRNLAYHDDGAIRLRAPQNKEPIKWDDMARGAMSLPAIDRDPVILKSNGLPPYSLGHIIDDTEMGTTVAVRGEEWIASTNEHIQLYNAVYNKDVFKKTIPTAWKYCHIPVICILDNGNKRKLSKRKDREALVENFLTEGYPTRAVIEYLLTIYNTDYEIWREQNPNVDWRKFNFRSEKIGSNSPLFDRDKLDSIARNIIAEMTMKELEPEVRNHFGDKLSEEQYKNVFTLLAIDRGTERPRKDICKYSEILTEFDYLFKPVKMTPLLKKYAELISGVSDKDTWFPLVKEKATDFGFKNVREFTQAVRVELTVREKSTDLYTISKILL